MQGELRFIFLIGVDVVKISFIAEVKTRAAHCRTFFQRSLPAIEGLSFQIEIKNSLNVFLRPLANIDNPSFAGLINSSQGNSCGARSFLRCLR